MVAFVATALAADRMAAASPVLRPQVGQVARRVADRLVLSFRRVVCAVEVQPLRRQERIESQRSILPVVDQIVYWVDFSPFQNRLPPPAK